MFGEDGCAVGNAGAVAVEKEIVSTANWSSSYGANTHYRRKLGGLDEEAMLI